MASFTAITDGMDWQDVDVINELITAFNEAFYHFSENPLYAPISAATAGYDIQYKNLWVTMQQRIIDQCTWFIRAGEPVPGVGNIQDDYRWFTYGREAGTAPGVVGDFYDVNVLRNDPFTSGLGFRRVPATWDPTVNDWTDYDDVMYTDTGATGGTPTFGVAQTGDIIGPWLFDDLQKAILGLQDGIPIYAEAKGASNNTCSVLIPHGADWATAYADATAGWPTYTGSGTDFLYAFTWGKYNEAEEEEDDDDYTCGVQSRQNYLSASLSFTGTISFYVRPTKPIILGGYVPQWDAGGSGLTEDTWSFVSTETAASPTYSALIGDFTSVPPSCTEPTASNNYVRGFEVPHDTYGSAFGVFKNTHTYTSQG